MESSIALHRHGGPRHNSTDTSLMDTALGPKTAFYRSTAAEQWRALPRQPEVQLAVGVGVVALFIITVSAILIYVSGQAFAEILFGIGCLGWSIGQLWQRVPAFVAWRRIGAISLVAPTLEMRQGEPWRCAVVVRPRRALVVTSCTLTAWSLDSRQGRGGGAPGTAWAFDVLVAPVSLGAAATTQWDTSMEIPPPPDAAPSHFGSAWTRRWTITAELTTSDGAHWRRDYPVLVFPARAASAWAGLGAVALGESDAPTTDDAPDEETDTSSMDDDVDDGMHHGGAGYPTPP
jgi:hypothetical protein